MAKGTKTGGGSRRGKPNKVTGELKAMILGALSDAGGQRYLLEQARENPTAFMTLVGKVLPLTVTGADGGPLTVEIVRFGQGKPPV